MFQVDEAQLYYEVRGSGPELIAVPGAGGDGGFFEGLAEELADAFTVITYDRRGNSRSTGRTSDPLSFPRQASDAKALISGLTRGSALVFGNSAGALIALQLATQHPEAVRGLIAHEPPAVRVLPEGDPWRDFYERISERHAEAGPLVTASEFIAAIRGETPFAWDPDVTDRFMNNVEHLFSTEWEAFAAFEPDYEALKNATFPILLGAGSTDRGAFYARPSVEIARRIEAPWAEFPGTHMEFTSRPYAFGAAVRTVATEMYSRTTAVPEIWEGRPDPAP
ncbi:alpha/beta fold hydrolase [Streptomyces sp. SM11]|uniref:alpha/beta fold hydrolase n=1 Tax=Streptomyces sp. SM11 TaxID=565557 RepID=UPI00215640A4|nr:alpha/beta hydrolase [Streptomyces sp. SM11]